MSGKSRKVSPNPESYRDRKSESPEDELKAERQKPKVSPKSKVTSLKSDEQLGTETPDSTMENYSRLDISQSAIDREQTANSKLQTARQLLG